MSAIYMSQLSAALPLMEGDHHHQDHYHHQGHFQGFTMPKDPPLLFPFMIGSSASDSSLSYGSPENHLTMRQQQAMLETQHMIGGSSVASVFAAPFPTVQSIRDDMIEPSSYGPYDIGKLSAGVSIEVGGNWVPPAAKMRVTRKASADPGAGMAMKKPRRRRAQAYEDISSQPNNNLGVIRVCSDCNTTKTPLWRSGPCGPKSLCNACGIRQRKARRAMMVSADGVKAATSTPSDAAMAVHRKVKKEKRADVDRSLPFKKRCKVVQDHAAVAAPVAAADKTGVQHAANSEVADAGMMSRDDLVDNIGLISWSRPSPSPVAAAATACSSFRPSTTALPVQHDEITDAAMLLMTLSCGLVPS